MIFDIYGETYFEQELLSNPEILNLVVNDTFAKNLYASLCNTRWVKGEHDFSASWRYAAGVVAHLRNVATNQDKEDYLDFYMSGCEGELFPDVLDTLTGLGWTPKRYDES